MNYENGRNNNSRFASSEEIKESLYKIPLNNGNPEFGGIPLYTDSEAVYVESTDSHTLIDGSTASMKTRLIAKPSLLTYIKASESFIAVDPKAELYEKMYPLLKEKDYKIFVLNLRDFENSNCWNPLLLPYHLYHNNKRDKAIELVMDFASCLAKSNHSSDPYWHNSASDLLTGLILILFECAKEEEINFKSLSVLRTQGYTNIRNDVPFIKEHFLQHLKPSTFVRAILNGSADVCDSTRGCIVSVFDAILRPFIGQEKLIDNLSYNEIDMESIGKEKTGVFLIIPDENMLYYSLISVFIKQCYTELILEAQKQPKKTLPRRVNFLLDEFASLPTISDFPAMITASRSRNIRFNLIIQSFNQLYQRYGGEAGTIKGNCENWIILHSREKDALEELVYLAGNKNNEEPLITPSLIQTLSKDKREAFILHKRCHPFITNLLDIDSYPDMKNVNEEFIYPRNNRKVKYFFDIEKFCNEKGSFFISQLFQEKTHEEISNDKKREKNHYMRNDEVIIEPLFKSTVSDDDEKGDTDFIERVRSAIDKIEESNTPQHPFNLFGIEHGYGWYGLTLSIIEEVRLYNIEHPEDKIYIEQIKEKFGSLNFYLSGKPDYLNKMIRKAEYESKHICEKCGARGKTKKINNWYFTLCEEHRKAKIKAKYDYELEDRLYKEMVKNKFYGWK